MTLQLEGIIPAMVTPLREDGEGIDISGLKRLIRFLISSDVDGLLILGGTGEYVALSETERRTLLDYTIQEVNDRIPVFVGILSPGLLDSTAMAEYARDAQASAIMVVTPYYTTPTQDGIVAYFTKLAESVCIPIILYNIPSRTGVNMQVETVQRLVEGIDSIIGIKECSRDLGHVAELIRTVGARISVLCGEEDLVLPELILGARGAILASANLIPRHWRIVYDAVLAGDIEKARENYLRLEPLLRALFEETNPAPLKEALRMAQMPAGPGRYPLMSVSTQTRENLRRGMKELGGFGSRSLES